MLVKSAFARAGVGKRPWVPSASSDGSETFITFRISEKRAERNRFACELGATVAPTVQGIRSHAVSAGTPAAAAAAAFVVAPFSSR